MRFNNFRYRLGGTVVLVGGLVSALSFAGCGSRGVSGDDDDKEGATLVEGGVVVAFPIGTEDGRSYDTIPMGRMAEGDVVEGRFGIANGTDRPLVIIQVITGCGCTTADYDPAPIPAGDTIVMTWRFDSRGRYGQQFKSIEIITADRQCATVYLSGEVVI